MQQFLEATILGLPLAAILAVAASGLVLTYTTTGIFNFAHGALGMLGAFAYWELRFDWGWPAPIALLVVLVVLGPLVGVLLEVGIMRGLSDAPETVRIVVSISLLVAALGVGLWIWPQDEPHAIDSFWGSESVRIFDVPVTYHEIAALAIALGLAVGLRLLLFNSRPGLAMRAAVDDRPLAMLNGARPDRSAMLAWAIGCSCAALSGILMSGQRNELSHVNLTLLIVNAYAAAMIGRLRNLPMTFLGALVIGLADSYAVAYLPDDSVLLSRIRFALPAIILFAVLMVMRQPKPRGHSVQRTREVIPRPSWRGAMITAGAFVAAGLYLSQVLTDADALSATRVVALAIIGLSLVPLVGFAGQLSLCQMSFAGIGAVVMAWHGGATGSPVGLVYAALITAVVGALVAIPAIRLGGLYLALATGAFAAFMDQWVLKLEPFDVGPFTIKFFQSGSAFVERPDLLGTTDSDGGFLVVMSVMFAAMFLVVVWVRRSRFGQSLLAMKDSPAAAATIGLNITATKFAIFTLSAGMAGFGGALYGSSVGSVSPDRFLFFNSLPLVLLGVVGGIGTAAGALLAGTMLGGLPLLAEHYTWLKNLQGVLPGTMGITLGRSPNGIASELREGWSPLAKAPAALAAMLVAVAAVLGLRWAEVVNGPAFVGLLFLAAVLGPLLVRIGVGGGELTDEPAPDEIAEDTPLEWLGIDRPFTSAEVAALDRAIGLETQVVR